MSLIERLRAAPLAALLVLALAAPAGADGPGPAHEFPVTREGDAGLPGHTIFFPSDLEAVGFKLPIVVWGNGGCRNSNEEYRYFLTRFTARGHLVVANGPPENPYNPEELEGILAPEPAKLTRAIDWALAENRRAGGRFEDRLDPTRVVVMGQSCGGWEAVDASADKRVTTTVVWNNGGDPHAGDVTKLHAPVLFVSGGRDDYTYLEAFAGYQRTPDSVPAVHADHAEAGHTGFWDDPPAPEKPPGPYQDEPLLIASQWLDLTLYGRGRDFFLGDECGLCRREPWTVNSKNWAAFDRPPSEAPPVAARPAGAPAAGEAPARSRACGSRRSLVLHLRGARGRRVRRVEVYVDGRRTRVQRSRTVRLDFRGRSRGTVRVRLVARLAGGRRVEDRRSYRLCA